MSAWEKGDLDLYDGTGVPPSEVSNALRRLPGSRVLRFPVPTAHFLVFDATRPPFDDPLVRRTYEQVREQER
jgi:ABC-type transport system substrate-binding protein